MSTSEKNRPIDVSQLSSEQLQNELEREKYKSNYISAIKGTVYTLITVAAVAVLVAVLFLPVLRIFGSSMAPTLEEGDIVLSLKHGSFETGDVVAFYYNNKILVKRVIAQSGEVVDIDQDGTVFVDGVEIEEPYVSGKAFGDCDIELPYQVPDGRLFVMGDQRDVSVDSRNTAVGPVSQEQIVGRIVLRVWPLADFGRIR
ncbi:MAG: signal peptidase I [Firmicutes bacterium]|nr:signal peptidase I [Bacillota bacterium]